MKSIKYILIVVILSGILMSAIPVKFKRFKKEVILECVDNNAKKEDLVRSVIIFKNRLHTSGCNFKVKLKDDKTISISFRTEEDYQKAEDLISSQAYLGFYLPYDNEPGVGKILKNENLLKICNGKIELSDNYEFTVILVNEENKTLVENVFQTYFLSDPSYANLSIAWGKVKDENGKLELFLLEKYVYIDGPYISKSYDQIDKNTNSAQIMIEFTDEGSELWSNFTEENINKSVSIVFDGEVYSSPKIMDRISGGKAMISGNFTTKEAKDLATLIQNGELPLEFRIKE